MDCWTGNQDEMTNNGSDMLIMASAAKSGAVLSARIVAEVKNKSHKFHLSFVVVSGDIISCLIDDHSLVQSVEYAWQVGRDQHLGFQGL